MLTIYELNEDAKNEWWKSSDGFDWNMPKYTYEEKKNREAFLDKLIDNFIYHISRFPSSEDERLKWKQKGNAYLEDIISKEEIFKLGILEESTKESFFKSTKAFISRCREYDKFIKFEDIGQALRNVWIVNIFQRIIGQEVEFSKSIFAYSMLYPYTDNFLDDVKISNEDKKKFNFKLQRRLNGEFIKWENENERKIFDMVGYIEEQYNRSKYEDVYNALLSIHKAQEKSLNQQDKISSPYENDILGISIEKGGTSVLVDAYLINGVLSSDEQKFAYKYGFLLQICDDLQDVCEDIKNRHTTIISQVAGKYSLDKLVNKLINFTEKNIENSQCFKGDNVNELKKLIKENCILMMLVSVVKARTYYSKEYLGEIEEYLPFTSTYIESMNKKINKKFKKLKSQYYGVDIENIIQYLFDI